MSFPRCRGAIGSAELPGMMEAERRARAREWASMPPDIGEVAKRSNAADCKSVALAASEVRILPSPPAFARSLRWLALRELRLAASVDSNWRHGTLRMRAGNGEGRAKRRPPRERSGASGAPRESAKGGPRGRKPPGPRKQGGSNSVVESQPSKLLVAGSIPVSRSILRSPLDRSGELRVASR